MGKVGWLGKDAGPGIQLSKSATAPARPGVVASCVARIASCDQSSQSARVNRTQAVLQRGTKDVPLYKGATCTFESKKVSHKRHKRHKKRL